MLTESQNHGIRDMLKTGIIKLRFAGGTKNQQCVYEMEINGHYLTSTVLIEKNRQCDQKHFTCWNDV